MKSLRTKLRRHVVWPLVVVLAAIALGPVLFFFVPPSALRISIYAAVLIALVVVMGYSFDRNFISPIEKLARITDEIAPGALDAEKLESDEITTLAQTISQISRQIREKEATWLGDV